MKTKKIVISIVLAVLVVVGGVFAWYYGTTLSAQGCIDYCKENTKRDATVFRNFGGHSDRVKTYSFWVAEDGDSTKPQEIFVFRSAAFLGLRRSLFNRYKFITGSTLSETQKDDAGMSSIQFFMQNDDDEKENTYTQLFYGSRAELPVFYGEWTITTTENGKTVKEEKFDESIGYNNNEAWLLELHGLGNINDKQKKEVTEMKVYDESHKLLYTYH